MPSPSCESCKDTCTDGAKCGKDCKCGDNCKCGDHGKADKCGSGCSDDKHSCKK